MIFFDSYIWFRAKSAKASGMTHYGWYYFVPIYIGKFEGYDATPIVAPRLPIMSVVMTAAHYMEGFINQMRGGEDGFAFVVGGEIK